MKHISILLSLSTLLVACGSGSSGDSATLLDSATARKAIKVNFDNVSMTPVDYSYTSSSDKFGRDSYIVNIGGKKIEIFDNHTFTSSDSDWKLRDNMGLNVLSNKVKFYQLTKGDSANGSYKFYVGEYANDMPTTGTVEYNGRYELAAIDENHLGNEDQLERLEFTADFGNKLLSGEIKGADFSGIKSNIKLNGKISGSRFSGTATLNNTAKNIGYKDAVMSGGFFGDQGKTAGGIMVQDGGNNKQTWSANFFGKAR